METTVGAPSCSASSLTGGVPAASSFGGQQQQTRGGPGLRSGHRGRAAEGADDTSSSRSSANLPHTSVRDHSTTSRHLRGGELINKIIGDLDLYLLTIVLV
ncbi:unnamed protein product [Cuscuta europaea]|uniref:Uncharacterized protein n=1 Tax=Cuscuta europaea TaxID=41803 RepID=A0A9P0ZMZ8_CUSEU|nr:unnamed protein product [Cuscuta europaea]